MKRLILAGGGHAHIEVLRTLAAQRPADVEVVLVSPYPWLTYSGMVPGLVAGHYTLEDCAIELGPLVRAAGARFIQGTVAHVAAEASEVVCSDATSLPYDVLSLDVGSAPQFGSARGVERFAVPSRPLERLVAGWGEVAARARDGAIDAITLVGAGGAGVELAFAMEHRLRTMLGKAAPHVRIVGDSGSVLPEWPPGARWRARRRLDRRGIGVHLGAAVAEVGAGFVRLASGLEFATSAVFWMAGAGAQPWFRESGLATDERGFLLTTDLLQSPSHPRVFGAGDCAVEQGFPLPRAGVFAVRAGPALAHNLIATLKGERLRAHLPERRYLALLSTGGRHAIGMYGGLSFQGGWAWRWKDRIDRRFVAGYRIA